MTNKAVMRVSDNGSKIWSVDELPHREDGPAIEQVDGSKYWFIDGLYHREDGPALDEVDGARERGAEQLRGMPRSARGSGLLRLRRRPRRRDAYA